MHVGAITVALRISIKISTDASSTVSNQKLLKKSNGLHVTIMQNAADFTFIDVGQEGMLFSYILKKYYAVRLWCNNRDDVIM